MSDQPSDRIELGSTSIPDVLRTLANVLPQFEGEALESQLQNFDTFLGILCPSVRPRIASLLLEAASRAEALPTRTRIQAAPAESIAQGGRAAEPYDHAKAMQSYQESFQAEAKRSQSDFQNAQSDEDIPPSESDRSQPEADHSPSGSGSPFREAIKRRAILMEIGGFRPPENPKTSWFGKVAFGLPDEEWPMSDEDRPLAPLAQVNLTELPFRPPHLADVEFLTVFIDPDEMNENEPNGSTWCVRAYPSLSALVPLKTPDEVNSEINSFPMRHKIIEEDYPVYDDIAGDIPDDLADSYHDAFENVSGFKLGGWPSLIQSEICWGCKNEDAAAPQFVFQIDSTEKGRMIWGDGGVGYFGRGTAPGHENEWFFSWQCY